MLLIQLYSLEPAKCAAYKKFCSSVSGFSIRNQGALFGNLCWTYLISTYNGQWWVVVCEIGGEAVGVRRDPCRIEVVMECCCEFQCQGEIEFNVGMILWNPWAVVFLVCLKVLMDLCNILLWLPSYRPRLACVRSIVWRGGREKNFIKRKPVIKKGLFV